MEPRPVHDEAEYRAALEEIRRLWDAEPGSEDERRLADWGLLVDLYERRLTPPGAVDPVEIIAAEMEMSGRTRSDLAALIGQARATEILSKVRPLTLPMIRAISAAWDIPADLLIPSYEVRKTRPKRKSAEAA